jgi:hypothetical protein
MVHLIREINIDTIVHRIEHTVPTAQSRGLQQLIWFESSE